MASVPGPGSDSLPIYSWQDKQAEGCQRLESDPPSWRRGLRGTDPAVGTQNGGGADSVHNLDVLVSWSEMQVSPSIGEPNVGKLGNFGGQPATWRVLSTRQQG